MQLADLISGVPDSGGVWDGKRVHQMLLDRGEEQSQRSTERLLEAASDLPKAIEWQALQDEDQRPLKTAVVSQLQSDAKRKRQPSVVLQLQAWNAGGVVSINDGRLGRQWVLLAALADGIEDRLDALISALDQLVQDKPTLLWPQGEALVICRHGLPVKALTMNCPVGPRCSWHCPPFTSRRLRPGLCPAAV